MLVECELDVGGVCGLDVGGVCGLDVSGVLCWWSVS